MALRTKLVCVRRGKEYVKGESENYFYDAVFLFAQKGAGKW